MAKKKHFGKPKSAGKLWWCKVMQEKWLLTHDFKVRACCTPDPNMLILLQDKWPKCLSEKKAGWYTCFSLYAHL